MIKIAIVGATGLVGKMFLKVLEEKELYNNIEYTLFASKRSKGKIINFFNKEYKVIELNKENIINKNFNYALFSAGSKISLEYAPIFKDIGCIVIDNSNAFRMYDNVPLVVPEVNKEDIFLNKGIIANPNCSTIQAVVPLKALEKYNIQRVIYSTYQAVSGAGHKGILDLYNKTNNKFPFDITKNCIPHIDIFLDNNYTKEEIKMINETKKILHNNNMNITATCVRVPILNSHSESINIQFEKEFEIQDIIKDLKKFENIKILENDKYPINEIANGTDYIYIGRIRKDYSIKNGINLWVVADNIRKGAATNAIQILEVLLNKKSRN